MVGTVGRTDLLGPEPREDLARQLYRALRDEILTLPDDLAVYPTHGAGSFCSAPGASERTTTIGRERATNPMLAVPDEDTFVERLLAGFGIVPDLLLTPARTEPTRPAPLRSTSRARPTRRRAGQRADRGRARYSSMSGRSKTSRPVTFRARCRSSCGPCSRAGSAGSSSPTGRSCSSSTTTRTAPSSSGSAWTSATNTSSGELDGGMTAWRASNLPEATIELVGPEAARATIVDVRQRNEYDAGHVPAAVHIELGSRA